MVRRVKEDMGEGAALRAIPTAGSQSVGMDQPLDYTSALNAIYRDAAVMCAQACNVDGTIRNVALFDRSLRIRLALLRRAAKLAKDFADARRAKAFFDVVVEEIGLEAPELRRRLIARLRALWNRAA
jgi:hypothetical protein